MTQSTIYRIEAVLILIAIIASGIGIYYLGPSITGFIIKEFNYEENMKLSRFHFIPSVVSYPLVELL